jgi:hypothetical protein
MKNYYTIEACENLMQRYEAKGGEITQIYEGGVGLGLIVCHGEGLKTVIISEVYLNAWSSAHSIRMYDKMPEKYRKLIEKAEAEAETP